MTASSIFGPRPSIFDLRLALQVDPQDGLLLRVLEQLEGIRNGSSAPAGDGFSFSRALSAADKRSSKSEEKKQAPTPTNDASFGYEIWHANRLKWMGMTEKEEVPLPPLTAGKLNVARYATLRMSLGRNDFEK